MIHSDDLRLSSPLPTASERPAPTLAGSNAAFDNSDNQSEAQPAIIDPLNEREIIDKFYSASIDVEENVNFHADATRREHEQAFGLLIPDNKVKYEKQPLNQSRFNFDGAGRFLNYVKIPGFGTPHENCGNFFSVKICTQCGKLTPRVNTCDRPSCPICWQSWARKEAGRIEERFTGFRNAFKKTKGRRLGNPMHLVFSPPQEYAIEKLKTQEGRSILKQEAIWIAKKAGIYGGVAFLHPYRVKETVKPALNALTAEGGKKIWGLIHKDALELGSWHEYVVVSPHIHIVGHGSPPQYAKIYEKTGWIAKFIRHVSGEGEVAALSFYELSHVGIENGRRSVSWFGSMSYNQLKKGTRHVDFEEETCEACGGDMIIYYPDTGRSHPAILKTVWWEYKMKERRKK